MALSGVLIDEFETHVIVQDPIGPCTSVMPIETLKSQYGVDKGRWTHSFFTVSPEDKGLSGGGRDGDETFEVDAMVEDASLLGGGS